MKWGTSEPYALYGGSYGAMMGSDPLYGEGGNPFDAGHGCSLITLKPPTKSMLKEAAAAGFYTSPHFGKFPKL